MDVTTALRGTQCAPVLKTYAKNKDGRGAFLAFKSQCAGREVWFAEIEDAAAMIADRVWKGNTNHTLERHVMMHRTCYARMAQGAEHIPYQLPNGTTQVKDLLKLIQCSDPELQAAIANVHQDDEELTSKANNFEATATHVIPRDPVCKR